MTGVSLLFLPPLKTYWLKIHVFITTLNMSVKDYIASNGTTYVVGFKIFRPDIQKRSPMENAVRDV